MRKINLPIYIVLIFISVLLIVNACKKLEYQETKKEAMGQLSEDKFFNMYPSANSMIQTISASIKRRNAKAPFVQITMGRIGLPRWN